MQFRFRILAILLATSLLLGSSESSTYAQSTATETKTAPLSIVVFTDFACPFSAEEYFTLQRLEKQYPGRLHVTYKNSPLPLHPGAPLAHRAALAAARQGKYDAMAELLYANQKQQERPALFSYARQLHLDMTRFTRDFDSPAIEEKLAADMEESRAFGIKETPSVFFNGKALQGLQTRPTLVAMIEKDRSVNTNEAAVTDEPALNPALITLLQARPTASEGAIDAPLTLVEFTDFQCPFCKAAVAPMEQLMAERGQQVRWVFRAFPLDFHPDAELAAEAALAAGDQGKFWPMHDLLFAHQNALKLTDLRAYALQLGLNMPAFDDALTTHRFAAQVAQDRALGLKAGVNGTPTFVMDGRVVTGVRSLAELEQFAEAHRNLPKNAITALDAGVNVPPKAAEHIVVQPQDKATALTLTWFTDVRSSLAPRQAELIRKLQARYNGRLRVLYKAYVNAAHPDGALAGAALLAAVKQDAFWPMYDALSERGDFLDAPKLISIAQALRLDSLKFRVDLENAADDVSKDREEATRRGIQGAPVMFVQDQRVDGLQREDFYISILDEQLKGGAVQVVAAAR